MVITVKILHNYVISVFLDFSFEVFKLVNLHLSFQIILVLPLVVCNEAIIVFFFQMSVISRTWLPRWYSIAWLSSCISWIWNETLCCVSDKANPTKFRRRNTADYLHLLLGDSNAFFLFININLLLLFFQCEHLFLNHTGQFIMAQLLLVILLLLHHLIVLDLLKQLLSLDVPFLIGGLQLLNTSLSLLVQADHFCDLFFQ